MVWLELSKNNVSSRPYESAFHISALVHALTKKTNITLQRYLKCSVLFLCWEGNVFRKTLIWEF